MNKVLKTVSVVMTFGVPITFFLDLSNSCYNNSVCLEVSDFLDKYLYVMLLSPLVLFFGFIIYKKDIDAFKIWHRVTLWYSLLYIIFSFYLSEGVSKLGGGLSGVVGRGFASILIEGLLLAFFVFSLVMVFHKYLFSRGKVY